MQIWLALSSEATLQKTNEDLRIGVFAEKGFVASLIGSITPKQLIHKYRGMQKDEKGWFWQIMGAIRKEEIVFKSPRQSVGLLEAVSLTRDGTLALSSKARWLQKIKENKA
jgi:hypothetical protein